MNIRRKWKRRILAGGLILTLAVPTAVQAASTAPVISGTDQTQAQAQVQAQTGYSEDDWLTLRAISEGLGGQVTWEASTATVRVERVDETYAIRVGETRAERNGKAVHLSAAPVNVDGSIRMQAADFNKLFQVDARWNGDPLSFTYPTEAYTSRATTFVYRLIQGDYTEASKHFSSALQEVLTPEVLTAHWTQQQQLSGKPVKLLASTMSENEVHRNVKLRYETDREGVPFTLIVRYNQAGEIDDFAASIMPEIADIPFPSYADPAAYEEEEVVIGKGNFALPGTLSIPQGAGPFPAVVLVHGSGANDQDETIMGTKVFRDLAAGLADAGIAVLRYDKITWAHSMKVHYGGPYTVEDETVDDAVLALESLQRDERIDPARIYAVGHSQGGMVMPRIIDQAGGTMAGAVLMAGPAKPLEDIVLDQLAFAIEITEEMGQPTEAIQQQYDFWQSQVKILKNPDYSIDNIPAEFQIPNPVWWFDLRNTYPAQEAKDQRLPMLILQGENDYQVGPEHLQIWKETLAEREDVQYKLYPHVNHLFTEYEEASTGAEYARPLNVPHYIVTDIADWIMGAESES